MSTQTASLLPTWLTALLAGALLAAIVYGTFTLMRRRVAGKWIAILTGLRLTILAAFLMILLQPLIAYHRHTPELIVLVDVSPSMGKPGGDGTRLHEVTAMLQKSDLAAALKSRYHVYWFALDRTARPPEEADLTALTANGTSAHFADGIEAARKHVRAFGNKPHRLLLVSDGNGRGSIEAARTAQRFGLKVDVLAPTLLQTADTPTVAISEVQSAPRTLLGSDTTFRVTLNGNRPANKDRSLTVQVTEDGKMILEHAMILKAGRVEATLKLTYRPAAVGLKHYGFHLTAGGDPSAKPYPLTVQVLDNKYEVLILEDRWRWEYKYLHRLFEDDPSFRFSALLSRGDGAYARFGSPDRRVNLVGFPETRADLEGFDTFVLGDVDLGKWPRGLASDLARLVADEGRSLVVVAGPSLASLREIPELHAILPVELTPDSGTPIDGPLEVRLRPDSDNSPFFFQVRAGAAEKLTPLDQIYPVLRKRPGATVLLEAVNERNPYGNRIVIAEQTVGRGRVLFVATDTLWKWHTLAASTDGPTPYSIFWQQAFRTMTPARSNLGAVNLWLTPDRSRAEVGQPIKLQAEVESSGALPPTDLQAVVTWADNKQMEVLFSADRAKPNFYHAEFLATKAGLLRVSASLSAKKKVLAEAATTIQADEPLGDSGIDLANLARIAQDTGGRVIDPADPETWPMPDEDGTPPGGQPRIINLWSNFTLLLALCALLGVDWFIRLFKGLVSG